MKMIAIDFSEPGEPGVLQVTHIPEPIPQPKQVLIKVAAAGVNRPDIMQRRGLYPPPAGASPLLGLEVAGTVVKVGNKFDYLKPGDRVCALVNGGGYAEYCLAHASCCLPIPHNFDFVQAAAIPETLFTVWSNLFYLQPPPAGTTLLVHGGSSGIGSTAIQLAKAFGLTIYVTAGSPEKCQFCLDLGADEAIDYRQQDFVKCIKNLTDDKGVDIILDIVGGDYLSRNLTCLSNEGRLIQLAVQQGAKSEINLWTIMQKRITITGSTLRSRSDQFKAEIATQCHRQVWPLFESGKIKPIIYQTFPLQEAAAAHHLLESSHHMGKIVLKVTT